MGIPTAITEAIAANQPLIASNEQSQYSKSKETWAEDSGPAGEKTTAADQIISFGTKSAAIFAAYHAMPNVAAGLRQNLQSTQVKYQNNGNQRNIKTVGDVFSLETGKDAMRAIRSMGLNAGIGLLDLDYQNEVNFWYSGLKKVEDTGLNLPIFDNVIKLFTKATYLSDILSYSVKRNHNINFNISGMALGATGRQETINLYSKQLGIDSKKLDLIDYLVYNSSSGQVFEGKVDRLGRVTPKGEALNTTRARAVDKGAFTEGLLTVIDPSLGLKDRVIGGTYAEKIGGNEGFILLSDDVIDPEYRKILGNNPSENKKKIANAALYAESYVSMALQRTSKLMSEMFNEFGSFFEYLHPTFKKDVYGALYRNRLIPRITHGHGMAMLGRYSMLASGVGLALTSINQVGYSLQHGNAVSHAIAGATQTVGLAAAGAVIGKKFFNKGAIGAAVGGGLGILGAAGIGPFSSGPIPGFANLYGRATEIKAYIGEYTGMSSWRRSFEEMMPGSTNVTTALGLGVAASTLGVLTHRYVNKKFIINNKQRALYLESLQDRRFERSWTEINGEFIDVDRPPTLNQLREQAAFTAEAIRKEEQKLRRSTVNQTSDEINRLKAEFADFKAEQRGQLGRRLTEEQYAKVQEEFLSYTNRLRKEAEHGVLNNRIAHSNERDGFVKLASKLEEFSYEKGRQEILNSTRGMGLLKGLVVRLGRAVKEAPKLKAIAYGALGIALPFHMLTSGLGLGSKESPRELRELNQGKRLEAVRRNQFWEMGQGGYEGGDILFHRPNLIARLSSGATQAGSSGNRGPLEEFILKNFTYKIEREEYWKRPAPITGAAFDQVPFIYPFIQPFTDLIKKPKLMHVDEWAKTDSEGRVKYLERSTGLNEIPDERLGGIAMAAPMSPYSPGRVWGKTWQQATDLSGLVGYFARTGKKALTGEEGFGEQRAELESFSLNMDISSKFYDLHGGGSFLGVPFVSEPLRRFMFKPDVSQYNPIKNIQPNWLPFQFQYGNPYVSLKHGSGEFRMPGEGYEALHPELKGVNPEDYPLLHKMKILGDLAPYSPQYKAIRREADLMQAGGDMTKEELSFFHKHKQQIEARRGKQPYSNYAFKPSSLDSISGKVTSVDRESMTFTIDSYGGRYGVAGISNDTEALISDFNLSIKEAASLRRKNQQAFASKISIGDTLSMQVPASIGQAVDESGVIKAAIRNNGFSVNQDIREEGDFAKEAGPISNYAMTNPLGRFVGRAWEAGTHAANRLFQPAEHLMMFGAAPVNKLLPYRDALEDYEARELYGTEIKDWNSPIGGWLGPAVSSALHNYLGLDFERPRVKEKRDTEEYFDKLKYFKYNELRKVAEDTGDLGLVKQYSNAMQSTYYGQEGFIGEERLGNALGGREALFAMGFANEFNPDRQGDIIAALPEYKQSIMQNFYLNQDMEAINRAATSGAMSSTAMDYAAGIGLMKRNRGYSTEVSDEQYYENKEAGLSDYFQYRSIPKVDWIGFNPAVDLEDVKLKYIESEGMDYHDFGIYPSRASYAYRKPYITSQDIQGLNRASFTDPIDSMGRVNNAFGGYGIGSYNINGPNRDQSFFNLNFNLNHSVNPFEG